MSEWNVYLHSAKRASTQIGTSIADMNTESIDGETLSAEKAKSKNKTKPKNKKSNVQCRKSKNTKTKKNKKKQPGSGGIRTHASEETGALIQRLRPLGHATSVKKLSPVHSETPENTMKLYSRMSLIRPLRDRTHVMCVMLDK